MLTKWFWDWERTEAVAGNEYFMGRFKVLGGIPVVQMFQSNGLSFFLFLCNW